MNLKNKFVSIAIAIFLMLSMSASTILMPNAGAHSPPWNIATYSFVAVSPDPVGIGQEMRVNLWVNIPPPTASGVFGDRFHNMTVKVTLPDLTTTTLGPFISDDTGGAVGTYTPTKTGNYSFQMIYSGETLVGANPPPTGFSASSKNFIGDYMQPSVSNIETAFVQQEPVTSLPENPLPTVYWTRPINALNNNWYSIGR